MSMISIMTLVGSDHLLTDTTSGSVSNCLYFPGHPSKLHVEYGLDRYIRGFAPTTARVLPAKGSSRRRGDFYRFIQK